MNRQELKRDLQRFAQAQDLRSAPALRPNIHEDMLALATVLHGTEPRALVSNALLASAAETIGQFLLDYALTRRALDAHKPQAPVAYVSCVLCAERRPVDGKDCPCIAQRARANDAAPVVRSAFFEQFDGDGDCKTCGQHTSFHGFRDGEVICAGPDAARQVPPETTLDRLTRMLDA